MQTVFLQRQNGAGLLEEDSCSKRLLLQRRADTRDAFERPPFSNEPLLSSGQSLNPLINSLQERRSGHDLSRVTVHGPAPAWLQRKSAVGEPGDIFEQEADRISEKVMRTAAQKAPHVRRQAEGEKPAQPKKTGDPGMKSVPPIVADVLRSAGNPLDAETRAFMEPPFGCDFSGVRVHVDAAAEQSARKVNANAYTAGHHIVFASGRFAPKTQEGRRLIAHELVHVLHQSAAGGANRAHGIGSRAQPACRSGPGAPPAIQRDKAGGGSTEFKDVLTVLTRPTTGPGIVRGTMTRIETAPASGSQPKQEIHRGEMNIEFNPADCSITIPFGYKFIQAPQASGTGICDEPPASKPVKPLPAAAFNSLKASVLSDVNRGLNNWFDVRLSGTSCPGGCANKKLPIEVLAREDSAHPDTTITVVNRGGRADSATICAASWNRPTAVHEGGHQVLGVGDEYPETDERLRKIVPAWFRPERVRHDYSVMGPEEDSRFAMFHERHFNAVKTFLEGAFPGCSATLSARSRPILPDFRITTGIGYVSLSGTPGLFVEAGLRIGLPLDRLRRWELVLGPQLNYMNTTGETRLMNAFLLGARFGLERNTGGGGHGFSAGAFGELGYGSFSSVDFGPGGAGSRSAQAAYGEIGLSAGYRTPIMSGPTESTRFRFGIEAAAGTALGAPGIIGPMSGDTESDPARSRWFRLGFKLAAEF